MRLYNLYSKLETAIEDPCVSDFVASTPLASALQNLSAQRERSFQFLRGIHVSSCLKDQGVWNHLYSGLKRGFAKASSKTATSGS